MQTFKHEHTTGYTLLNSGAAGLLVIDLSTVLPAISLEVASALAGKGMLLLDAPVTGGRLQAEQGALLFLVGGPRHAYQRADPLFEAMGRRHLHLGNQGMGACAKLCDNLMGLANLAVFCEGMAMGIRYGLDPAQLYEVISNSGGRSALSDDKGPRILTEDWSTDFALTLGRKDVGLVRLLAQSLGQDASLTDSVYAIYESAAASLDGTADVCILFDWYASLDGGHSPTGGQSS